MFTIIKQSLNFVLLVGSLAQLAGCGGASIGPGGSRATVSISPANPTVYFGHTQQFTATVAGVSNPVIQWSVGVIGGSISQSGLYTAPIAGPQATETDTVTARIAGGPSASTAVTVTIAPLVLTSITPNVASAGETITFTMQENLATGTGQLTFPAINGAVVSTDILPSVTQAATYTTQVPFGAVSGPVYIKSSTSGINQQSNSLPFTRLPNLRIHAPSKDLSSGEAMQFSSAILGPSTPNQINWTATSGTISPSGLYQAPSVTSESSDLVKGCVQGTNACDSVLLRILPLKIIPDVPILSLGGSLQLDADLGGSPQSAQWSVLAGGGSVASNGLYNAPSTATGAGPVAVSAAVGSTSAQASLSITGVFPGMVNRVYDYVDFQNLQNIWVPEGSFSWAVTASGNRAYSLDLGSPFNLGTPPYSAPSYSALEVYDTTVPGQAAWLGAVESVSTLPTHLFTYGNYLFEVDSGFLIPGPTRVVIYNLQSGQPVLGGIVNLPDMAFTTVNNGIVYGLPVSTPSSLSLTSFPVYLFDLQSGTPVISQYTLPLPVSNPPIEFLNISGTGNTVYISWIGSNPFGGTMLSTYDISTSTPTMVSTIPTQVGFSLQAVNSNLLFADTQIYDISNVTPVPLTTLPVNIVRSVQGNTVVAQGLFEDWLVIDVSNPANPIVTRNVMDQPMGDIINNPTAALSANNLLTTDGLGGVAVYDVSAPGGPASYTVASSGHLGDAFDQVLHQSTLYVAGETSIMGGGLDIFDLSGPTPTELGSLLYPPNNPNSPTPTPNPAFAVQVSGNNVFLGLADSIRTVNVSNPAAPVETGSFAIPTNALALSGSTLFVGTGDSRLVTLDVSNPNAPQQLASVALPGSPNTLRISGNELFVSDVNYGLLIFDISNPAAPILLSQTVLNSPVWDTTISGATALVAADASGLVLLDVSKPANVKQLSLTLLPLLNAFPPVTSVAAIDQAIYVSVQNGLAYVDTLGGFVVAYDFSNPAYPRLVALNGTGLGSGVYAIGNNLYLTTGVPVQIDNSAPFNSIQLFYPPSIFLQAFPLSQIGTSRSSAAHLSNSKMLLAQQLRNSPSLRVQTREASVSDCKLTAGQATSFWLRLTSTSACRHLRGNFPPPNPVQ